MEILKMIQAMKKMIISFGFVFLFLVAHTQNDVLQLSIDQALEIAITNNKTILKAKNSQKVAQAELKQTNAAFLPSLEFSMAGIRTNDPLSSFGFKLKQEVVTQNDFDPAILNDPLRMDNFTTKIEMQVPILNMDGFHQYKAAKLNAQANSFLTDRSIQQIMYEVKKVYYRLELSNEVVRVVSESLKMAESALKLTKDNLEQGFAKETDVLLAQVRLADVKAKLIEVENLRKDSQEYFLFLLGMDDQSEIIATDKLTADLTAHNYLDHSIENRSDLRAYKTAVDARKQLLSAQKMNFVPRVNAFGSTEWNDKNFLGTSAKSYTIGAMLSWKLFNGNKNVGAVQKASAQLETAKIEYDEYLAQNTLELNKAKRNKVLAFEQIKISELSKEQASESYRIIKNRYAQGLEKTTDLLYAENLASNRKLDYLQSLYKYQMALSYLEFLLEKSL
jgi:outer membrane protein TolC